MRLTKFSHYALRVLLYLQSHPGGLSTISEIANSDKVSKAHLMKVVQKLGRVGFVETMRGYGGGLRIAHGAEKISLGRLLRETETAFQRTDPKSREPALSSAPSAAILGEILEECLSAQLAVLDRFTLADLCANDEPRVGQRHASRKAQPSIAASSIVRTEAHLDDNAHAKRAVAV